MTQVVTFLSAHISEVIAFMTLLAGAGVFASGRSKRFALLKEYDKQINALQKEQKEFWEELRKYRIERDEFEREVIVLRSENKSLKAKVARLQNKLNKYIKENGAGRKDDS